MRSDEAAETDSAGHLLGHHHTRPLSKATLCGARAAIQAVADQLLMPTFPKGAATEVLEDARNVLEGGESFSLELSLSVIETIGDHTTAMANIVRAAHFLGSATRCYAMGLPEDARLHLVNAIQWLRLSCRACPSQCTDLSAAAHDAYQRALQEASFDDGDPAPVRSPHTQPRTTVGRRVRPATPPRS